MPSRQAPVVVLKFGSSVLRDELSLPAAVAEIYREVRRGRRLLPKPCTAAMLVGWQADAILRRVQKGPAAVREGRLQLSEFHRRRLLAWRALTGRW